MTVPTTTPRRRPLPAILSLLVLGLAACASGTSDPAPASAATRPTRSTMDGLPGGAMDIFNEPSVAERMVEAPIGEVWLALAAAYSELDIPMGVSDPGAYEYGNASYRVRRIEGERLSKYFNCGIGMTGPLADEYILTASIVSQLSSTPNGTRVLTTVSAEGKPRATSGTPIQCASRGVVEMRIGQLIVEALPGGA